jgi:hypothetical protein
MLSVSFIYFNAKCHHAEYRDTTKYGVFVPAKPFQLCPIFASQPWTKHPSFTTNTGINEARANVCSDRSVSP